MAEVHAPGLFPYRGNAPLPACGGNGRMRSRMMTTDLRGTDLNDWTIHGVTCARCAAALDHPAWTMHRRIAWWVRANIFRP